MDFDDDDDKSLRNFGHVAAKENSSALQDVRWDDIDTSRSEGSKANVRLIDMERSNLR